MQRAQRQPRRHQYRQRIDPEHPRRQSFLDGANSYRGFFVISGPVNISDLTIQNTSATGGKGGAGLSAGGGGMGAGGGLFVNSGANVGSTNVDLHG